MASWAIAPCTSESHCATGLITSLSLFLVHSAWQFPICNAWASCVLFQVIDLSRKFEGKGGRGHVENHSWPTFARLCLHGINITVTIVITGAKFRYQ